MKITDEAIEAAADAIIDAAYGQELPEAPVDLARAAVEAALPHIVTQQSLALDAVCKVLSDAMAFGRQATDAEILAAVRGQNG